MDRVVVVLNGPNLGRLGRREPDVYGSATLDEVMAAAEARGRERGVTVVHHQSDHEGELIAHLHDADDTAAVGVVLNAAGLTHTSVALRDAVAAIEVPVVECHLSNVHAREPFRHTSLVAGACLGVVAGFGPTSYLLAIDALVAHADGA